MEVAIFGLYALFALNDKHVKNFLIEANKLDEIKSCCLTITLTPK